MSMGIARLPGTRFLLWRVDCHCSDQQNFTAQAIRDDVRALQLASQVFFNAFLGCFSISPLYRDFALDPSMAYS